MTSLSKNFSFNELTNTQHSELLIQNRQEALQEPIISNLIKLATTLLQPIRDNYGHPISINSGFRCSALNTIIHGAIHSQHLTGEAADLDIGDQSQNNVLFELIRQLARDQKIRFGQLILEGPAGQSWVHVSLETERFSGEIMTFDGKHYSVIEKIIFNDQESLTESEDSS